ncbi:MAG: peptidylprolyl isomerase [Terricaulis sp.]
MKHTLIQTAQNEPSTEAFSGCSHGPAPAARRPANAPPVFVNGIAIPETAIAQEAQNHDAASGPEARAAAARALVIRELLLSRARAQALQPTPTRDAHGREETDEEALIRQVLELEVVSVEPSEAECRRVYKAAASEFIVPELYEASHILFAPEQDGAAAWVAAHGRAVAAIKAIGAGEPFAEWARACSACPTAEQSGSLGQLQRGDLADDLERALIDLSPGQIGANPVRTRHGWHVIRLDRRSAAKELPFEAVEAFIKGSLRTRAWAASSARYVAALAASAQIEGLSLSFGATA